MGSARVINQVHNRFGTFHPFCCVSLESIGGGVLKERVIRELPSKKVVSYALAYINPLIFSGDNGRVLGYDNIHGYSHRHFMGAVTPEPFTSYEALYDRFEQEWQSIAVKFVNGEAI